MKRIKKLMSRITSKKPTPPAIPRVAAKSNYTAEVAHLNVASIVSDEVEDTEFDAALASYLNSKK